MRTSKSRRRKLRPELSLGFCQAAKDSVESAIAQSRQPTLAQRAAEEMQRALLGMAIDAHELKLAAVENLARASADLLARVAQHGRRTDQVSASLLLTRLLTELDTACTKAQSGNH